MTMRLDRFDRRQLMIGTAVAALLTTTPLAVAQEETPPYGGTLRFATLGLDTADPHRHTGSIGVQQVYAEALTSIADDGSVKPWLAESFEVSDDGRVYSFTLRDGVTFHNGEAMTAEDVKANFERIKANVTSGWLASAMKLTEAFEAPDARTFVVRLAEPYAAFLPLISEAWILSPDSPGWDETITTPIGTGPFEFGEWTPQVMSSEYGRSFSLRSQRYKQITEYNGDTAIYDLVEDPGEKTDISESRPFVTRYMRDLTGFFLEHRSEWKASTWGTYGNHSEALAKRLDAR